MNIVLDIDGTLLETKNKNMLTRFEHFDYIVDEFAVFYRPHLCEFLDFLSKHCRTVSIFTASTEDYAYMIETMLRSLNSNISFDWILSEKYVEYDEDSYSIKNLEYIWNTSEAKDLNITRHNTFLIDNFEWNFRKQPNNGILVKTFYYGIPDKELFYLEDILLDKKKYIEN